MELTIGNCNVVDQSTSLYHYKALIETLLSMYSSGFLIFFNKILVTSSIFHESGYGQEAKSTILQTALFIMDQPSSCTTNTKDESDTKSGYARRKAFVQSSQEVPFATNLHLDFLTCPRCYKSVFFNIFSLFNLLSCFFFRWIPPGCNMRLKMIRNDDDFVIIADSPQSVYKIKLLELFIEFRKIGVDAPIMKRELGALQSGKPYIMPFLQSKQLSYTINKGLSSFMMNELCTGVLPTQLMVCFVRHDAFNSSVKKNGYIFENMNINKLVFKLNGENYPPVEYRPDFSSTPKNCLRGKDYSNFRALFSNKFEITALLLVCLL